LLRRTRDFAQVKGSGAITLAIAKMALSALEVDQFGLDEMDNRILSTIIEKFKGGPVGLTTIATACGEEAETIEEVYVNISGNSIKSQHINIETKITYQLL
jgi:Holliday junction DNA helicase RuvB